MALEQQLAKDCTTRLPRRCIPGSICVRRQEDSVGEITAHRGRIIKTHEDKTV